jgi:hypothetical protein
MLLRVSQETSFFDLFLRGTANPARVRQLTDKAEARRAASAQASFPARRACEKTVPEKVTRRIVAEGFSSKGGDSLMPRNGLVRYSR